MDLPQATIDHVLKASYRLEQGEDPYSLIQETAKVAHMNSLGARGASLYTVSEIADAMGISRQAVRTYISREPVIEPIKVVGRNAVYSYEQVGLVYIRHLAYSETVDYDMARVRKAVRHVARSQSIPVIKQRNEVRFAPRWNGKPRRVTIEVDAEHYRILSEQVKGNWLSLSHLAAAFFSEFVELLKERGNRNA